MAKKNHQKAIHSRLTQRIAEDQDKNRITNPKGF
jgi:hypothetical protein